MQQVEERDYQDIGEIAQHIRLAIACDFQANTTTVPYEIPVNTARLGVFFTDIFNEKWGSTALWEETDEGSEKRKAFKNDLTDIAAFVCPEKVPHLESTKKANIYALSQSYGMVNLLLHPPEVRPFSGDSWGLIKACERQLLNNEGNRRFDINSNQIAAMCDQVQSHVVVTQNNLKSKKPSKEKSRLLVAKIQNNVSQIKENAIILLDSVKNRDLHPVVKQKICHLYGVSGLSMAHFNDAASDMSIRKKAFMLDQCGFAMQDYAIKHISS